jgi:hypothetical protein
MSVISTGAHPKTLWPGVHKFCMGVYDSFEEEYSKVFNVESSDKAYEEDVETTAFDLAQVTAEGSATPYTGHSQGFTKRYTNVSYRLGYIVTADEIADNLYEGKSFQRSKLLARSFRVTKEIVHWNILNRATSGSYVGGDGVALLSTAHPTLSGNMSNKLATDADLSEASLEDLLTMIRVAKNSKGHPIMLKAEKLVVSPYEAFNAERILHSTLQNDTADNAVNAVKSRGLLPGGYIVGTYLTDADAWFIKTNADAGLTSFKRKGYTFTTDNDFDTDNAKAKGHERYVPGWTDWRGVYGTAGI